MNEASLKSGTPGDTVLLFIPKQDSLKKKTLLFNDNLAANVFLDQKKIENLIPKKENKYLDSIKTMDFNKHGVFVLAYSLKAYIGPNLEVIRSNDKKNIHLRLNIVNSPPIQYDTNPISRTDDWMTEIYKIEKNNADSLIVYFEADTLKYSLKRIR